MIVIEGPDGSGKSTLASQLAKHYQTLFIHGGGPLKDRDDFVTRCRDKGWLGTKHLYIFDRVSYISEPVYAWLAGREPLVSIDELHFWIAKVKPVIIFCCLDTSAQMLAGMSLYKDHKTPEHISKVIKEHLTITARYKEIMSQTSHLNFNYNKDDIRNLITEINHRIL